MSNNDPLDGPSITGFQFERALGRGGFSDVYLYKQKLPRRHVAIKVLHVDALDKHARKQFVAEANLMAQLSNHPAIATIYSVGISDNEQPYFVMEHCSGGSLSPAYRTSPLSIADVLRIGIRVSSALDSAHAVGIFHRDVKPGNILITDYGLPVLTDFGISIGDDGVAESTMFQGEQLTAMSATGSGSQGLSIPWAPPEALDDVPVGTARSDVYSLAATLFSLLEGRSPFEVTGASNGPAQLVRRIERGELNPMTRAGVPERLIALIAQGMARDPLHRPATALAVAQALQSIEVELGLPATPIEVRHPGAIVNIESTNQPVDATSSARHAAAGQTDEPPVSAGVAPLATGDTVLSSRVRRGVSETVGTDLSQQSPPPTQHKRRRRVLVILIGAAALAVGAGIAAFAMLGGPGAPGDTPGNSAGVAATVGPEESLRLARTALERFAESQSGSYRASLPDLVDSGYAPGTNIAETVVSLGKFGSLGSPYCISVKVTGDEAGHYSILQSGPPAKGLCPQKSDRVQPSPDPQLP